MSDLIAVTGATGELGSRVATRLLRAGRRVRVLSRDPSRLPDLPGAIVAPPASYRDAGAMRAAVDGAGTLLFVSAHEGPNRRDEHVTALDAAVAAGVERIVYVSFLAAAADATFTFARDHWYTEQHIRALGVPFTFLRDSLYQSGLAAMAGGDGVLRGPAGQGAVAAVTHDDVADAAVAVLTGDGHEGATYDITGPAALTMAEVAAALSHACGRDVAYVPESHDEAVASRQRFGAPAWEVEGWVSSYEAIGTGELSTVSDAVPRLTGRPATSFAEFLAADRHGWQHLSR